MRVLLASRHRSVWDWNDSLIEGGFAVDVAADEQAINALLEIEPLDAVVADYAFFDSDLRDRAPDVAVLVLTDEGRLDQRIDALRGQSEDALTADLTTEELALRVALVLLRRGGANLERRVELGDVVYDRVTRKVWRAGEPVHLSPTARCVFDHLVAYRHRLVPEAELLDHCWNADLDLFSEPLRSQIHRLRQTFAGSWVIRLVPERGYRIQVVGEGPSTGRGQS